MPLTPYYMVRNCASVLAIVLALQGAWILATDWTSAKLKGFPQNKNEAAAAAEQNPAAITAAWVGWLRGDLWNAYAITANAIIIGDVESGNALSNGVSTTGRNAAEAAVTKAPSDARGWSLLALNNLKTGDHAKAAAALKMSFYTSPYNRELFPLRIQIASRLSSTLDDDLSNFVEYELGIVTRREPGPNKAISSAYAAASAVGRKYLETTLAKLNPKYLLVIPPESR